MASYWWKKDKRVKRVSDQHEHRGVIQQVKDLKADGYVRVSDRRNPEDSIVKQPKTKPAPKPKKKAKVKKK